MIDTPSHQNNPASPIISLVIHLYQNTSVLRCSCGHRVPYVCLSDRTQRAHYYAQVREGHDVANQNAGALSRTGFSSPSCPPGL